ncbi:hypothetical protein Tco_1048764 [Tanacetum coccineum]
MSRRKGMAKEELLNAAFTHEYDLLFSKTQSDKDVLPAEASKKKKEKSSPSKRELSCFMIPLPHKGDFLLNKDLRMEIEYLRIKPQYDETKDLEEINLNVVIRSKWNKGDTLVIC